MKTFLSILLCGLCMVGTMFGATATISSLPPKATIADLDPFMIDDIAGAATKKVLWSTIKAQLQAASIFQPLNADLTALAAVGTALTNGLETISAAAAKYQPLDADLTNWSITPTNTMAATNWVALNFQPLDADLTELAAMVNKASNLVHLATNYNVTAAGYISSFNITGGLIVGGIDPSSIVYVDVNNALQTLTPIGGIFHNGADQLYLTNHSADLLTTGTVNSNRLDANLTGWASLGTNLPAMKNGMNTFTGVSNAMTGPLHLSSGTLWLNGTNVATALASVTGGTGAPLNGTNTWTGTNTFNAPLFHGTTNIATAIGSKIDSSANLVGWSALGTNLPAMKNGINTFTGASNAMSGDLHVSSGTIWVGTTNVATALAGKGAAATVDTNANYGWAGYHTFTSNAVFLQNVTIKGTNQMTTLEVGSMVITNPLVTLKADTTTLGSLVVTNPIITLKADTTTLGSLVITNPIITLKADTTTLGTLTVTNAATFNTSITLAANRVYSITNGANITLTTNGNILTITGPAGGSGTPVYVNATAASDATSLTNTPAGGTATATTWTISAQASPAPDLVSVAIGNASATDAGAVTTGTQTMAGAKTFSTSVQSPIFQTSTADPADTGVIRLANADIIAWENGTPGTDISLQVDSSNIFQFGSEVTADGNITGKNFIAGTTNFVRDMALKANTNSPTFIGTVVLPIVQGTGTNYWTGASNVFTGAVHVNTATGLLHVGTTNVAASLASKIDSSANLVNWSALGTNLPAMKNGINTFTAASNIVTGELHVNTATGLLWVGTTNVAASLAGKGGLAAINTWSGTSNIFTTPTHVNNGAVLWVGTTNVAAALATKQTAGSVREIWVPSSAMFPDSAVPPALYTNAWATTTDGQKIEGYNFDADTDEILQFTLTMPSAWDAGNVKAKFVWKQVVAGSLTNIWGIVGGSLTDNETGGNTLGTAVTVQDIGLNDTNKVAISSATAAVTIGGTPAAGHMTWFKVYRDANAALDEMVGDAFLIGVHLQYTESTTAPAAW